MATGVWVAFHFDLFGIAVFNDELEARAYADKNNMSVTFVKFGEDIRRVIREL